MCEGCVDNNTGLWLQALHFPPDRFRVFSSPVIRLNSCVGRYVWYTTCSEDVAKDVAI